MELKNDLTARLRESSDQWHKVQLEASDVPRVQKLSPLSLKNFLNDLDNDAACTVNKFPDDITNDCTAHQKDLNKR